MLPTIIYLFVYRYYWNIEIIWPLFIRGVLPSVRMQENEYDNDSVPCIFFSWGLVTHT